MYRFVTTLVLLMLSMVAAAAEAQTSVAVRGVVVDQTGAPLPGVIVEFTQTSQAIRSVTTDADGSYRIEAASPGPGELTLRLVNFSTVRRVITLRGGETTANVTMWLSLRADVSVTAASTFRNVADVENPAENLVGIAASASQGAITAAQLSARPIMRPGEVLETVPGMIVSQHSGEGKANQYYLRGFNLDHGTDFSTTVAGVPVNTPTGAHAHGYADSSFLIPELVSGVQFKKGPYFADEGDFSAAGAANINYVNTLVRPLVSLSAGDLGWARVFAAASPQIRGGHLLAALELNTSDGPWERPDDYKKLNAAVRYSHGDSQNGFSLTGMAYSADWNATDQVPARAIDNGTIPRFGHIDPTDRGSADRQSLAVDYQRAAARGSLRATGYVLNNNLDLISNFTYFLDDPERGDQFQQREHRLSAGGRVSYRRLGRLGGRHAESSAGVQVRRDWIDPIGLYRTSGGRRVATTREDAVGQTMTGIFGQSEIEWSRMLRTTAGLRADFYQFDVTSLRAENSGAGSAALVSPKFGAVIGPWSGTEFYVNAGMGFHSNDARGAVMTIDPVSGEPVDSVTPLVRAKGAELGVRTVAVRGLQSTVALWFLGIDSELLFVGDAGTTEAGRPSRRLGVEWANYWRPRPWLTADVDISFSRARFTDEDPAGDYIPGALDRVISAGLSVEPPHGAFGTLRLRHFGPRPLIEDASLSSKPTTLWNAEAGYRLSNRSRLVLEIYNVFNTEASDIDYFYASRLAGEPAGGIEDLHTHPALPRSFRLSLQLAF
jgi:hypothetical protein